jgi:hypothetical protein
MEETLKKPLIRFQPDWRKHASLDELAIAVEFKGNQ